MISCGKMEMEAHSWSFMLETYQERTKLEETSKQMVVQLAASGNFDDALALCKMLPPEDAALRSAKEDSIHIRYGQFLFNQGQYADALQHFGVSSLHLRAIVSMFSSITLPPAASNLPEDNLGLESLNGQSDLSLNQVTSEQLDETTLPDQEEKVTMDAKQRAIALSALTGFLMARRGAVVEKAEAEDTDAAVAAMVEVVQAKRGSNVKRSKPAEKSLDCTGRTRHSRELATVLDTALVQAYLLTDQCASALQLLKGPNYCDVTTCKDMMMNGGHFAELIELYKYNRMHQEALQLLNRIVGNSDTLEASPHENQQFGFEALVEYLKPLGGQDSELILEHSNWLLKNFPEQAVILLGSMDPPISPNLVSSHLKEHAPSLQSMYLEQMLKHDAKSLSSELQNELVQLYLSQVLEERSELQALGKWEERQYTETRKKLLSALDSNIAYNAEVVLRRLPMNGLYEERALLLGKMKQHQLALTLYAHKLHEPELALEYCDRIYSINTSGSSNKSLTFSGRSTPQNPVDQAVKDIYLILLEVYLKPQASIREFDRSIASLAVARSPANQKVGPAHKVKGHVAKKIAQIEGADDRRQNFSSPDSAADSARSDNDEASDAGISVKDVMLKEALELLTRRWDCVDGARALQTLRPDTKLQDLLPFLAPLLKRSSEVHRNASVIKSLRRGENVQVREELLQCRKRVVKITSDRTCFICHKRIGTSVFAVYPSGTLVHFVCYRDQNAKLSLSTPT
ncbi:hypothetical protein O6H91_Y358400 [Diphasiastrum complanatum]|nr:hypothetical protein O6H91_Y358400 [Diphasiastrum complanatum]